MNFAIIDQIVKALVRSEQVLPAKLISDHGQLLEERVRPRSLTGTQRATSLPRPPFGAFPDIDLPTFPCLPLPVRQVGEDCLAESYPETAA
jgi:hypothetical protein